MDEIVIDITDKVKAVIGNSVKYAAVGYSNERESCQDSIIEEIANGFILNPDWDGKVYILFESGAEIEISGSDYVSVFIGNIHGKYNETI